jgi:hypothetical protein
VGRPGVAARELLRIRIECESAVHARVLCRCA